MPFQSVFEIVTLLKKKSELHALLLKHHSITPYALIGSASSIACNTQNFS
jgi:hypothetical protein